ncbi:hypothetical protein [Mesorhizobium sp. M0522]|uniref:hypothetical protein n=1 Tax=Mesorhizobium sp. M0522 TaxID=2956958 RepID=UPI003336C24D
MSDFVEDPTTSAAVTLIELPVRARWALRNSSEAHRELAELRIDIGDGAIDDHYVAGVGRGTA